MDELDNNTQCHRLTDLVDEGATVVHGEYRDNYDRRTQDGPRVPAVEGWFEHRMTAERFEDPDEVDILAHRT